MGIASLCFVVALIGAQTLGSKKGEEPDPELTKRVALEWKVGGSSPGVELRLEEVAREEANRAALHTPIVIAGISGRRGGTAVTYQVRTSGFTEGRAYLLFMQMPDSGPVLLSDAATADTEGRVHATKDEPAFTFVMYGPARGETVEVALVSYDLTVKAFARAVPFPLEGQDRNCRLRVEPLDKEGKFYAIRGEGFAPSEKIRTESRSEGEVITDEARADEHGIFGVNMAPRIKGKKSGQASYTAVGQSCAPTVLYAWGKGANEPK